MKNRVEMCIPTQQIEFEPTTSTTSTTSTSTTTTTPPPSCPDTTWNLFDRGNYSWCMKIYWGEIRSTAADAACATLDSSAVTSGFQNVAEISTMVSVAVSEKPGTYYLAVGAKRREACKAVAGVTATCTAQNSFYWTDGYTYGSDGFNWYSGIPLNPRVDSGLYYMYCVVDTKDDLLFTDISTDRYYDVYKGAVCGMLAKS